MVKPNGEYTELEFRKNEEIPYLKGTRIRADYLYVDFNANRNIYRTVEDLAKDSHLPMKGVRQAVEWCALNRDLVTLVLARERKEAGVRD